MKLNQKGAVDLMFVAVLVVLVVAAAFTMWKINQTDETVSGPTNETAEVESNNLDTKSKVGMVERVSPDCGPPVYLDAEGNIVTENKTVPCDLGDFITVNGMEYQTSSGNVPFEDYWSVSTQGIEPGDSVEIRASLSGSGQYDDLSCQGCYLSELTE